ncbi:MAG: diguanylate cyclase [Thalassotalea sp.]
MPFSKLNDNNEFDLQDSVVLVVDDQPINIQTIYNLISKDYTILAATSGEEALEICYSDSPPDLILLDVVMEGISGIDTCRLLKQRHSTAEIPVIFVTSFQKQTDENECWDCGGVDFIPKPINPITLKNRVRAHLTLKKQKDALLGLVYIDGLTTIFNRRYFDLHIEKISKNSQRGSTDNALLMIDIDFFKNYNDNYGHVLGDEVLKKVARAIKNTLHRAFDFVARYGGEEFAVVLPDTDLEGAIRVAEELNLIVQALAIPHEFSEHNKVTISIGVSTMFTAKLSNRDLLDDADHYLYEAKETGRNKVLYRQPAIKLAN